VNRARVRAEGLSIEESSRLTERLTASRVGPSIFHSVLMQAAELRERGKDYEAECRAIGRKLRGERE
jgi:hypothetical protein